MRYTAYISYSHADEAFAKRLHTQLETYRVPRRLVQQGKPARLTPIFRDRADLRSSPDLQNELTEALRDSNALIVICSPSAAASDWVSAEVKEFKRLGRERSIFPIVVEGEPPECFPPALLNKVDEHGNVSGVDDEPVAADSRPTRDGVKDATLKIIAPLLDVGFDELKQRELHRKVRRFAIIAGVASVIAIVTATLAILAFNARNDAQRRQAAAEDLISFMIGDLRNELEAVGRLDILDAMGNEALQFYDSLESQDLTDAVLATRARVLRQIGEVWSAQGKRSDALRSFQESLRLAEQLSERNPHSKEILFEVGQAHFWVGYVLYSWSRLPEAKTSFTAYADVATRLLQSEPENSDYLLEAAYAQSNLGTIAMAQNELGRAQEHFSEAVKINQKLLDANPENPQLQHELAEGYSWMGAVAGTSAQSSAAIQWYQRELGIREDLAAGSDNKDFLRALANTQQLLAFQYHLAGNSQRSDALASQSIAVAQDLVGHDAQNKEWQRLLNLGLLMRGRIALVDANLSQAEEFVQQALIGISAMQQNDPSNTQWLNDYALAGLFEARIKKLSGKPSQAKAVVNAALHPVAEQNSPNRILSLGWVRGALHIELGDAHQALGETELAQQEWQRAIDLLQIEYAVSPEPLAVIAWTAALQRMGRVEEALVITQQLTAKGYGIVNKLAKLAASR